jgi:hypothetical protein
MIGLGLLEKFPLPGFEISPISETSAGQERKSGYGYIGHKQTSGTVDFPSYNGAEHSPRVLCCIVKVIREGYQGPSLRIVNRVEGRSSADIMKPKARWLTSSMLWRQFHTSH